MAVSIEGLNLSFSSACPATCVYCPSERGMRDAGSMKPSLVRRVVGEAAESLPWRVKTVQVGENGEALSSPHFIENLRIIRHHLPKAKVNLTTNLFRLDRARAGAILREQLLSSLQLNIDGHDARTYEVQKGLSYEKVMGNLQMFMELRKSIRPPFPVSITVLTLHDYCAKVKSRFGRRPRYAPHQVPFSSYDLVVDSLRSKEWMTDDVFIRKSPVFFWAERGMDINFGDLTQFQCPQLPRVVREAFISPSGLWYPCCLDSNQDQAYGNVGETTLLELHESEQRREFITLLESSLFEKIGYPCNRVPFCRGMK